VRFLESYCTTMRYYGRAGHALDVIDTSGSFSQADEILPEEQIKPTS
jgi:hypothetical protein